MQCRLQIEAQDGPDQEGFLETISDFIIELGVPTTNRERLIQLLI